MKAIAGNSIVAVLAVLPLSLGIVVLLTLQAVPADPDRFVLLRRWLYAVIFVLMAAFGLVVLARFYYFRK